MPCSSQGTSSLVRRTLYSVTDATDRIASSVSSGILASGAVDVLVRGGRGVVRPYGALDGKAQCCTAYTRSVSVVRVLWMPQTRRSVVSLLFVFRHSANPLDHVYCLGLASAFQPLDSQRVKCSPTYYSSFCLIPGRANGMQASCLASPER